MVYFIVIAVIIAIDYFSKEIIKKLILVHEKKEVFKNKLYLWHIKNKGIAYSKLEGHFGFIVKFTMGAVLSLFVVLINKIRHNGETSEKIALTLFLGGAVGNLIDRIRNKSVTDFIYIKSDISPIFNIADISIAIGGITYIISNIFSKRS